MTREQAEAKAAALNAEYDRASEGLALLSLPDQLAALATLTRTYVSQEAGRPGGYRTRSSRAHAEANGRYARSVRGQLLNYRAHIRRRIGVNRARLAELLEAVR